METIDFELLPKAFQSNDIEAIKRIVTCRNVNDVDKNFAGVVHYACLFGTDDPSALFYFASIGIHKGLLENQNEGFFAPLHRCAMHGKFQLVKALVQLGVSVNLRDSGKTPLDCLLSLQVGETKMCMQLLDMGATSSFLVDDDDNLLCAFVHHREATRQASIIVLGLHRCCCPETLQHNGKDVLSMIARCLWSMRGERFDAFKFSTNYKQNESAFHVALVGDA